MHHNYDHLRLFTLVVALIPIAGILPTIGLKHLMEGKPKQEHYCVGVDLAVAALVAAVAWGIEPGGRLLGGWISNTSSIFNAQYGTICAIVLDILVIIFATCIHQDYLKQSETKDTHTKWDKCKIVLKNVFANNAFGLTSIILTAYLVRG